MNPPDDQQRNLDDSLPLRPRLAPYHWQAERDDHWPHPGVQWHGYLRTARGTRIALMTLILHSDHLVLRYLVVHPAYRGQGLGRGLLRALLAAYPAAPIRLHVAPDADASLTAAQLTAWYARYGFVADPQR